jgi:putative Mg2+ transporter-C (MgtC) family protein
MALVAVGSCMFTALGFEPAFGHTIDPTRIAAQVVTGVGFLGAGSILRQGEYVRGLTTAASIWVAASLGMAAGFGYFAIGAFTGLVVIVTLVAIRPIEERFFRNTRNRRRSDPHPDEVPEK